MENTIKRGSINFNKAYMKNLGISEIFGISIFVARLSPYMWENIVYKIIVWLPVIEKYQFI